MDETEPQSEVLEIAAAVRRGRARRGWSQRELAAAADVSQSAVVRLERGDGTVSLGLAGAALAALGLTAAAVPAEVLAAPSPSDDLRDLTGRRLPAHLDPRPVDGRWETWRISRWIRAGNRPLAPGPENLGTYTPRPRP